MVACGENEIVWAILQIAGHPLAEHLVYIFVSILEGFVLRNQSNEISNKSFGLRINSKN